MQLVTSKWIGDGSMSDTGFLFFFGALVLLIILLIIIVVAVVASANGQPPIEADDGDV